MVLRLLEPHEEEGRVLTHFRSSWVGPDNTLANRPTVVPKSYLAKFGDVDQTCEVFQVGAFIVILAEGIVLRAISLP